jgi:hypothetical protein
MGAPTTLTVISLKFMPGETPGYPGTRAAPLNLGGLPALGRGRLSGGLNKITAEGARG